MAKKLVFGLLTVVLLCSLLFMAPACAPAEEKITVTAISAWPVGDYLNTWFEKWVEEVNKRGEGELEINLLGGPEVMSMFESTDAVVKGIYDIVANAPAIHYGLVPEGTCHTYANYFVDPPKIRETGLTARLDEIYREKAGLTWLGSAECNQFITIYTRKDFTELADLEGQKIRTVPGWIPLVKALGMVPTSIPTEELYEAFEKGIVDAFCFPLSPSIRELGVSTLSKHIILPSLPQGTTISVLMNAERFDALPTHLQKLLVDTIKELEQPAADWYDKNSKAEVGELKAVGVEPIELRGAELETYLKKTAKSQYDVFLADCPEYGAELMDMIKDYLVKVD